MPFKTDDPILEKNEILLTNAIAAGVKADDSANLTAIILQNGATCLHMRQNHDNDVNELLQSLWRKDIIKDKESVKKKFLSDEYDSLDASGLIDTLFCDIFEIPELISVDHIRCDSARCILLLERFKKLGLNIETNPTDKNLSAFVEHFSNLCQKHEVDIILGQSEYANRVVIGEPPEFFYQFNVSPEDMHKILMSESSYYAGYHHDGSILRLNEPNNLILKIGQMCIFPVFPLETGALLRNAGCNVTDVLASQLSFYIRSFIDPNIPINECYGHRGTPISEKFAYPDELVEAAKICLVTSWGYEDSQDGLSEISVTQEHLVKMDSCARNIYSRLSAVSSEEFDALSSVEVPIESYLRALIEVKKSKIKHFTNEVEELEKIPADSGDGLWRSFHLEQIKKYREDIEYITNSVIPVLEEIITKTKLSSSLTP